MTEGGAEGRAGMIGRCGNDCGSMLPLPFRERAGVRGLCSPHKTPLPLPAQLHGDRMRYRLPRLALPVRLQRSEPATHSMPIGSPAGSVPCPGPPAPARHRGSGAPARPPAPARNPRRLRRSPAASLLPGPPGCRPAPRLHSPTVALPRCPAVPTPAPPSDTLLRRRLPGPPARVHSPPNPQTPWPREPADTAPACPRSDPTPSACMPVPRPVPGPAPACRAAVPAPAYLKARLHPGDRGEVHRGLPFHQQPHPLRVPPCSRQIRLGLRPERRQERIRLGRQVNPLPRGQRLLPAHGASLWGSSISTVYGR